MRAPSAPLEMLEQACGVARPRVLVVHAHPDDETVQTGGLMASLAQDTHLILTTCTRGEAGDIVPGTLPEGFTEAEYVAEREQELAEACSALGIQERYFLGMPPARVGRLLRRDYRDSGMRWVREGLAGPVDGTDPRTFTSARLEEEVADLLALFRATTPDVILGYDREGSYGHPDHVRAHELATAAASAADLPLVEIASADEAPGFTWFDLSSGKAEAVAALGCHATQLRVVNHEIVHVGGQHQRLPLRSGLRLVR